MVTRAAALLLKSESESDPVDETEKSSSDSDVAGITLAAEELDFRS